MRPISPRRAALAGLLALACTVDSDDGATSLGGSTVPSTTAATTVSTTVAASSTGTNAASSDTADGESTATPGTDGSSSSPPDDSSGGATGPDEQPADGLYSACVSAVECFGTTACVLVMGDLGFCTSSCTIAGDCGPSPAGTAQPACVTAPVGGSDMLVCALDCSGGKTCPGGMECLPLGSAMVCV